MHTPHTWHAQPRRLLLGYAILASALFTMLALFAHEQPFFPADVGITLTLQQFQAPLVLGLASAVEWIGLPPQSSIIFGAYGVALFLLGLRWEATLELAAALGCGALYLIIEPLVSRPRPSSDLVAVAWPLPMGSFPSGHVAIALAVYGFLAYVAFRNRAAGPWRWLLPVLFGFIIVGTPLSRVYLGQHWASDVVGGLLLGSAWLAVVVVVHQIGPTDWKRRLALKQRQ